MATTPETRRRAPAMSPGERRAAIIDAALPLLAEHGVNVTTSQIAAAAGIAEGTVFRVFSDKSELIGSCLERVMRPDDGLRFIAEVPRELPLAERLSRVAHHMTDRMLTMSTLMHALVGTGYRVERLRPDQAPDREKWLGETTAALVDLIGPDAGALRLPPERAAQIFLGVVFSSTFAGRIRGCAGATGIEPVDVDELTEVFVHGVLKS